MDSEEDMQDARSETSEGEMYMNNEDECDSDQMSYDYGDEEEDDERDEDAISLDGADDSAMDGAISVRKQLSFTVLTENAIKERQEEAVESVAAVLSISKAEAGVLLRNFEWCVSRVNEEWFADEARVRNRVGLLDKPDKSRFTGRRDIREIKCGICLEYHPIEKMQAANCDHFYCQACWAGYAHTSIRDGPGCLSLRCPNPDCSAAVSEELILSWVQEEDKTKYRNFIIRSYVESNRKVNFALHRLSLTLTLSMYPLA